nr:olfactory receptor 52E2-like [Pelodiscus sinensis]|eukprot:XP_006111351.2 olfactory receptor 52E2-like [Pelodiscus sinensis]
MEAGGICPVTIILDPKHRRRNQENVWYMQETPFCLGFGHLPCSMSDSNTTDFTNPSTFILLGLPGLETAHVWIAIPFCIMYIIAILGNLTILFIVKMESSLHEPMYYFVCMLAVSDLVLSTSILPKMLSIFWFNCREINFSACLTQLYVFHCFSVMESGIFVSMALDRYVAICHPLRHSTIVTNPVVGKIGLAMSLRSSVIVLPMVLLARQWSYCRTNIIPQPYCVHIAVVKVACVFYIPGLFLSLTSRFDQKMPQHFHSLINNVYYLMPAMLNPIIYGMRTKQIRDRLLHLFFQKGT